MKDFFLDIIDFVRYEVLKQKAPIWPSMELDLTFDLHQEPSGGYWVSSKELPGLHASGDTLAELRTALFDTLLVYYDVPRYYAKKIRDTLTMQLSDGRTIAPPEPIFQVKLKLA
jgi:predicted RNase H-like HicB family nuclease